MLCLCDQQVLLGKTAYQTAGVCVSLTFINPPEPGVRAAVLQAGVLAFIHVYNVPVFSGDGHGEQDETQQTAEPRGDHNRAKVHLYPRFR